MDQKHSTMGHWQMFLLLFHPEATDSGVLMRVEPGFEVWMHTDGWHLWARRERVK